MLVTLCASFQGLLGFVAITPVAGDRRIEIAVPVGKAAIIKMAAALDHVAVLTLHVLWQSLDSSTPLGNPRNRYRQVALNRCLSI